MQDTAAKMGIVYSGIEEALKEPKWEALIHEKFMTLIPPTDHKFAALHGAVWSGGSFVYVPKGTKLDFPLQSYFRLNAKGAGQFEHTLIIVEDDARSALYRRMQCTQIQRCQPPRWRRRAFCG